MPLGFHGLDLIVILVIALLIFGPKKLPEMGSAIGKSIKEFRKGMSEITTPKEEEEHPQAIDREVASKRVTNEYTATATDGEVVKKTTSTTETHE
jgi:TatA/E family protein of Tat protein translocase